MGDGRGFGSRAEQSTEGTCSGGQRRGDQAAEDLGGSGNICQSLLQHYLSCPLGTTSSSVCCSEFSSQAERGLCRVGVLSSGKRQLFVRQEWLELPIISPTAGTSCVPFAGPFPAGWSCSPCPSGYQRKESVSLTSPLALGVPRCSCWCFQVQRAPTQRTFNHPLQ